MRKITKESVEAFINGQCFHKANMEVVKDANTVSLLLHGNEIARREKGKISISNCGWDTPTTKERLNGLLDALNAGYIYQKNGQWYWSKNKNSIKFPYNKMIDTGINFLYYALNK